MNTNKALWDRVNKTDPKQVKPITGKQYSGNSPKPYYIVERLTDEFGPCGVGWGYSILSERFERFTDTDVLHVAKVSLWYETEHGGNKVRGCVEQMGQTKAVYITSKGALLIDEDAPKKSVTDALVKCASYLGFAGDIFSGRWDDSKYVAELRKEFAPKTRSDVIREVAEAAILKFESGNEWGAYEEYCGITDSDERLELWGHWREKSKLRTYLKKTAEEERAKATQLNTKLETV